MVQASALSMKRCQKRCLAACREPESNPIWFQDLPCALAISTASRSGALLGSDSMGVGRDVTRGVGLPASAAGSSSSAGCSNQLAARSMLSHGRRMMITSDLGLDFQPEHSRVDDAGVMVLEVPDADPQRRPSLAGSMSVVRHSSSSSRNTAFTTAWGMFASGSVLSRQAPRCAPRRHLLSAGRCKPGLSATGGGLKKAHDTPQPKKNNRIRQRVFSGLSLPVRTANLR